MTRLVPAVLGVALSACADPTANIHGKIGLTTPPTCGGDPGDVVGFDLLITPAATATARSSTTTQSTGVTVSIACHPNDAADETPFDIDLDQAGSYGITITPWIWTSPQTSGPLVPVACASIRLAPRHIAGSVDLATIEVSAVVAP